MEIQRSIPGMSTLLLAIILLVPTPSPTRAHNVTVFAWAEDGQIRTESKFSGGRRAQNATIEVYDDEDNLVLTGTTDQAGRFDFTPPVQTRLKIVLVAGMGHRNHWILPLEEWMQGITPAQALPSANTTPSIQIPSQPDNPPSQPPKVAEAPTEMETLLITVDTIMAERLKPIEQQLRKLTAEHNQDPDLTDILGGIGYICGLVGVVTYMKARRKSKGSS